MGNEHKTGRVNPNKAGMYFSLVVCLVALIIGAISAAKNTNDLYNSTSVTTQSVVEIRKNKTDVTKQTTVESTTVLPSSTTEKPTTTNIVANHFVMPIGGTIRKNFSNDKLQFSETYGDWRLHTGIDIAAKSGTPISTAGKGKVKKVYNDELLGETVVIDHGNNILGFYCGLKNIVVTKGDILEIGQKIGAVGNIPSEIAEEVHLHFAVKKDDKFVDPIKELELEE